MHKVLQPEKTYISTHFNRSFLYKEFKNELLPIYKQLSRDELGQEGYIHKSLSLKDFNILIEKMRKENIFEERSCK